MDKEVEVEGYRDTDREKGVKREKPAKPKNLLDKGKAEKETDTKLQLKLSNGNSFLITPHMLQKLREKNPKVNVEAALSELGELYNNNPSLRLSDEGAVLHAIIGWLRDYKGPYRQEKHDHESR